MNKFVLIATSVISVAMTGCVSIEDQLNSQDPSVRPVGEHRLLTQARMSGKPEIIGGMRRLTGSDGWEKLCREGAAPEGTFRAKIEN